MAKKKAFVMDVFWCMSAPQLMGIHFDEVDRCFEKAAHHAGKQKYADACRMAVAALEAMGYRVTVEKPE